MASGTYHVLAGAASVLVHSCGSAFASLIRRTGRKHELPLVMEAAQSQLVGTTHSAFRSRSRQPLHAGSARAEMLRVLEGGDISQSPRALLSLIRQPDEEIAPEVVGEVALHAGGVRSGTVEFRDDLPPGSARHFLGKRCHLLGWRRVRFAVFGHCGRRRSGKPVRDVDPGEVGRGFLVAAGLLQAPRTMLCPDQFAFEALPSLVTDQMVLVDVVEPTVHTMRAAAALGSEAAVASRCLATRIVSAGVHVAATSLIRLTRLRC
ncbi:hypothetical protein MILUP08_42769 [Micromonospora lupini str. Lupac 08]|uniref:Uncharacterized protein n=1 Tax=Micromonospora lupini str. Lupac 08 TaxID=1150864 RepID=I0L1Z1_9ACTN|nr:hypothetical protein MILUP08_42769 [Micromonospora lupini str. Lupac 08]